MQRAMLLDRLHERYHVERRVRVLASHLAELVPDRARLLDVGCGDGLLSQTIGEARADVRIEGIDVVVRDGARIPVRPFDGDTLPFGENEIDVVMAVDVLHHADDPDRLLAEMARVARCCVLLKDHTRQGFLAGPTLRLMDWVGNVRHGVSLPYHYWTRAEWRAAFQRIGLVEDHWASDLTLYPWPASWLFDRSLHFLARLRPVAAPPASR